LEIEAIEMPGAVIRSTGIVTGEIETLEDAPPSPIEKTTGQDALRISLQSSSAIEREARFV